jgi:hypothetical protein
LYQKYAKAPNASQKNDSGELSLTGFRVQGSGFRVQGSGFRVQGSGFRVQRVERVQVAASPHFR